VTSDFKGKEIVSLLRRGLRVTVNSDDPAYFRSYKAENVEKMSNDAGVSRKELVQLERNAFEAAWLPARKREAFLDKLDAFEGEHC
jgi:adenosine deaminase